MSKKVRVTWVKSTIGFNDSQRRTIKALGLRRLHDSVEKEVNDSVQGMIDKVIHLIKVEELSS